MSLLPVLMIVLIGAAFWAGRMSAGAGAAGPRPNPYQPTTGGLITNSGP